MSPLNNITCNLNYKTLTFPPLTCILVILCKRTLWRIKLKSFNTIFANQDLESVRRTNMAAANLVKSMSAYPPMVRRYNS
jgi:hypothetical protein